MMNLFTRFTTGMTIGHRQLAAMKRISDSIMTEKHIRDSSTVDGVRVNFDDDSWILVRKSGTEGKIRVYCEGYSPNRLRQLVRNSTRIVRRAITTAQRSNAKLA